MQCIHWIYIFLYLVSRRFLKFDNSSKMSRSWIDYHKIIIWILKKYFKIIIWKIDKNTCFIYMQKFYFFIFLSVSDWYFFFLWFISSDSKKNFRIFFFQKSFSTFIFLCYSELIVKSVAKFDLIHSPIQTSPTTAIPPTNLGKVTEHKYHIGTNRRERDRERENNRKKMERKEQ